MQRPNLLLALAMLVVATTTTFAEGEAKEHFIYSVRAQPAFHASASLDARVITDTGLVDYYIPWGGIKVECRADGKDYTSFETNTDANEWHVYPTATLLVPCIDDVGTWRGYIAKEGERWEQWKLRCSQPHRILPPETAIPCTPSDAGKKEEMYFYGIDDKDSFDHLEILYIEKGWNHLSPSYNVERDKVEIKLRADGEQYTSVELGPQSEGKNWTSVDSIIIWVPCQDDVKAWGDWLTASKEKRAEHEARLREPRRILPPDND